MYEISSSAASTPSLPPGTILPYAGVTVPADYLECNGAAISRTTYASLFNAIGILWGAGDGSTTFNVPSLNNQFLRGTTSTPGTLSGADTHNHGSPLTTGTPSATQSATGITGSVATGTHTHNVVIPSANNVPAHATVKFIIKV